MDARIRITDLEAAINYWRNRLPAQGEDCRLCAPAAALATPYARMIVAHQPDIALAELDPAARAAYEGWRAALPDPRKP
ncbi:DUF3717 domain-containing protein [Bordetella sp. 2513F-2]